MIAEVPSKLEVGAALDTLTQGWDEKAAQTVIAYALALPEQTPWRVELVRGGGKSDSVTGTTPQHGEVTIQADRKKQRTTTVVLNLIVWAITE